MRKKTKLNYLKKISYLLFSLIIISCNNPPTKTEEITKELDLEGVWYELGMSSTVKEGRELTDEQNEINDIINTTTNVTSLDDFENISFLEFNNEEIASGQFELSDEKKLIRNYQLDGEIGFTLIQPDTITITEKGGVFLAKVLLEIKSDTLIMNYKFNEEDDDFSDMKVLFKKLPNYIKLVD